MKNPAFTLIELLVVIVIIGILSGIAVGTFNTYQEKARRAALSAQINQEKKVFVSECLAEGKNLTDCPVAYSIVSATETPSSALHCEMICSDNDKRMATLEEALWFAGNTSNSCMAGWHYTDNLVEKVVRAYPMYANRTTPSCGPLNTGDVARIIPHDNINLYGTSVSEFLTISSAYVNDVNNSSGSANCACIDYPSF